MSNDDISMLPLAAAAVAGGLATLAAYNSHLSKTTEEATYEYELWGKTVQLGIPPDKFPSPEEINQMESNMPGCQHGWFESAFEGKQLHYRKFMPAGNAKPKAIVVYHHGIQAHSGAAWIKKDGGKLNLTAQIQYYVEQEGFALYAMDLLGHGYSEGRRMFMSDYKQSVQDLVNFTKLAASQQDKDETPLFITGHSFGGALSLHVADHFQNNPAPKGLKGIVLIAPAIIGDLPPPAVLYILRDVLAPNYPTWTPFFMPNPVSSDRIWRDKEALQFNDAPQYKDFGLEKAGSPFILGTAVELLNALEAARETAIPALKMPFCVVHGTSDYGVPIEGTDFLETNAVTAKEDQSILRIEGAYHDLFADPAMDETMEFIIQFMKERMK
jgi:alpha-beta hydrolase superfamily lysophospholipase